MRFVKLRLKPAGSRGERRAAKFQAVHVQALLIVHRASGGLIRVARRVIPLPKQLLPLLKGIKKKSDSPFVVSANGKPVSIRSYQRSFELLLKRLNIPHKGFHSLRHTFATRALECGMDVKTLSEILGHKNPTVTLNRYAHSLMEHKADMMNRLGKLL